MLALAFAPTASAIDPACELPPRLPDDGVIPRAYNSVRDPASETCSETTSTVYTTVVNTCDEYLGETLCPV